MQTRNPNVHSLIGPNSTALIGPYEATLASKDANEDVVGHFH